MRRVFIFALLLALTTPVFAVQPDEVLQNPQLEARARALSQHLRCMVCQNQSIDDSDAPLARDLRLLVRERLNAGDSDSQVMDFIVSRYGVFVLLKPRFEWHTAALWLLPPVILLVAAFVVFMSARRRRVTADPALTEAERVKLSEILGDRDVADPR